MFSEGGRGYTEGVGSEQEERGDRIRAARKKRNWSQAKLAHVVGCSHPTIGRIERGETDEPRTLTKILRALELPIDPPPGVDLATGTAVASTSMMGIMTGAQTGVEEYERERARNEMVNLAVDNDDPQEVVKALRTATPPAGARYAWWANHYRRLLETHRPAPEQRRGRG